jgi:archaellum component FlaF (FlaF/FlaG flagellin family)
MFNEMGSRLDTRKLKEANLHSTVQTVDEGSSLMGILENGVSVAKQWASSETGVFLGFAYTRLKYPTTVIEVEELVVAAGKVTLKYTPTVNTQAQVRNLTDNAAMARVTTLSTGPAVITEYQLAASSREVIVNTTENGDRLRVTYRRNILLSEAETRFGFGSTISPKEATEVTRSVTVIRGGEIFIDNIDLATNWNATAVAYLGAGGLITGTNTSGIVVPGFRVLALPTADVPFLGFEFGSV